MLACDLLGYGAIFLLTMVYIVSIHHKEERWTTTRFVVSTILFYFGSIAIAIVTFLSDDGCRWW